MALELEVYRRKFSTVVKAVPESVCIALHPFHELKDLFCEVIETFKIYRTKELKTVLLYVSWLYSIMYNDRSVFI